MRNYCEYRCCYLHLSVPPFCSFRHSWLVVSISSTNWNPDRNQQQKLDSDCFQVQYICEREQTRLTCAVYSVGQSCRWLHLNTEDGICLSREHPQNWSLDKRKDFILYFMSLKRHKQTLGMQIHHRVGGLRLWGTSQVVIGGWPADCEPSVHPQFGSQLFDWTVRLSLCCLSLWLRLSLLALGCFFTRTAGLSWTHCTERRHWSTAAGSSAVRLHLRRLGDFSELPSSRFLFSLWWLCCEFSALGGTGEIFRVNRHNEKTDC